MKVTSRWNYWISDSFKKGMQHLCTALHTCMPNAANLNCDIFKIQETGQKILANFFFQKHESPWNIEGI